MSFFSQKNNKIFDLFSIARPQALARDIITTAAARNQGVSEAGGEEQSAFELGPGRSVFVPV